MADAIAGASLKPLVKKTNEMWGFECSRLLRILGREDGSGDTQTDKQDKQVSWWLKQAGGRNKVLVSCFVDTVLYLIQEFGPLSKPQSWEVRCRGYRF